MPKKKRKSTNASNGNSKKKLKATTPSSPGSSKFAAISLDSESENESQEAMDGLVHRLSKVWIGRKHYDKAPTAFIMLDPVNSNFTLTINEEQILQTFDCKEVVEIKTSKANKFIAFKTINPLGNFLDRDYDPRAKRSGTKQYITLFFPALSDFEDALQNLKNLNECLNIEEVNTHEASTLLGRPRMVTRRGQSTVGAGDSGELYATHRNISVTRGDLTRLAPETFLNDSLIDFYLEYIQSHVLPLRLSSQEQSKHHFFNSFLYTRWRSGLTLSLSLLSKNPIPHRTTPLHRLYIYKT